MLPEGAMRGTKTDPECADSVQSRFLRATVPQSRGPINVVALAARIYAAHNRFLGCHSMRQAMVTTIRAADVSLVEIAKRSTGHRNLQALSGYDDYVPADHPVARLGL